MPRMLQLTLDGREYRCTQESLTELTIKEARDIKRHTGMRIAAWGKAMSEIDEVDPDAFLGLAYLLKTRSGEVFDWSALDDMPIFELTKCFKTVDEPGPEPADSGETVDAGEPTVPAKNGRRKPAAVPS